MEILPKIGLSDPVYRSVRNSATRSLSAGSRNFGCRRVARSKNLAMLCRLTVTVDDLSKRALHTSKIADLALNIRKVATHRSICISARSIGVMRQGQ